MSSVSDQGDLELCIVLDITASMGPQHMGVVRALTELIHSLGDKDLKITLTEYTECNGARSLTSGESTGCLVSSKSFQLPAEAPQAYDYVRSTQLGVPRGCGVVSASGEDLPENVKAGMCEAKQQPRETDATTLMLVITDAGHHDALDQNTPTKQHEQKWLSTRQAPSEDSIEFLDWLVSGWPSGNLIIWPVLYRATSLLNYHMDFYAQAALKTNGGILAPGLSDVTATLSVALKGVVMGVLQQMHGEDLSGEATLWMQTMPFMDVSGLTERHCDTDHIAQRPRSVAAGHEGKEMILARMQHVVECVGGAGWSKRAVETDGLPEQLQLVLEALRIIATDRQERDYHNMSKAQETMQHRIEGTPSAHHVALTVTTLQQQLECEPSNSNPTDGLSCISMETVMETLQELTRNNEEIELDHIIEWVMSALRGLPIKLHFPQDKHGNPDFTNAWSAQLLRHDPSVLSGCEYMELAKRHAEETNTPGTMIGPVTRHEMNAFLPLVYDRTSAFVYWVLSGTQLLNVAMGLTMGGKGFVPNLVPGVTASMLWKIVRQPDVLSADVELAKRIVSTLRAVAIKPCRELRESLECGVADPASDAPKLIAAVLHVEPTSEANPIQLVLCELFAMMIQEHYGKDTPENNVLYMNDVREMFKGVESSIANHDPLSGTHPIEDDNFGSNIDVQELISHYLLEHPVTRRFVAIAPQIWALLCCNETLQPMGTVWPKFVEALPAMFLLRFRTARYTCEHEGDKVRHVPCDVDACELVNTRAREAYAEELAAMNAARYEAARQQCIELATATVKEAVDEKDLAGLVNALATASVITPRPHQLDAKGNQQKLPRGPTAPRVGGGHVVLDRGDVPEVLRLVQQRSFPGGYVPAGIVMALCAGDWTSASPIQLKSVLPSLQDFLEHEHDKDHLHELVNAVSKCARTNGTNRHGHSQECYYPGAAGWTAEYAQKRGAIVPHRQGYIECMRDFTQFANEIRTKINDNDRNKAEAIIHRVFDARQSAKARDLLRCLAAF